MACETIQNVNFLLASNGRTILRSRSLRNVIYARASGNRNSAFAKPARNTGNRTCSRWTIRLNDKYDAFCRPTSWIRRWSTLRIDSLRFSIFTPTSIPPESIRKVRAKKKKKIGPLQISSSGSTKNTKNFVSSRRCDELKSIFRMRTEKKKTFNFLLFV